MPHSFEVATPLLERLQDGVRSFSLPARRVGNKYFTAQADSNSHATAGLLRATPPSSRALSGFLQRTPRERVNNFPKLSASDQANYER